MGQFASLTNLTMPEVVTLVVQSVQDTALALSDLNVIIQGLTPPSSGTPPPPYTDLSLAVAAAISAANSESVVLFPALFPNISLPPSSQDAGVVLNYQPGGDTSHLTTQIMDDFLNWGIQQPKDKVAEMASSLQNQVDSSDFTPSTTYGQLDVTNTTPLDEVLAWVTAFGVCRTGYNADGGFTQAVIYSFCAAVGVSEPVTL
jgi:hypothetical protein